MAKATAFCWNDCRWLTRRHCVEWGDLELRHKGREKVRKYGATYKFVSQSDITDAREEGGEETCTVTYTPHFGAVPGYVEAGPARPDTTP